MPWAPNYALAEDLADYERADVDDEGDRLDSALSASSRTIDRFTRRQFGAVEALEARRYPVRYRSGCWVVDIDDLQDVTGLLVDGVTAVAPDLRPYNAVLNGMAWTRLVLDTEPAADTVLIVAPWGWSAFPETIVEATLLQASRVFKRRDAPFGVAGSPDSGSEMRLLAKLDPDVEVMCRKYRRTAVPR
jgi:hypothetical protein